NQASQNDPASIASNALGRHLVHYPADDPRSAYSLPEWQEAAKAATLERMAAFYRAHAGASDAELAIVGPVDTTQVTEKLRAAFDDWRSAQSYVRIANPLQPVNAARIVLDMPEKSNAVYTALVPLALDDADADVPALFTAVQLLGGRAGTRLWNRLREQEGLSYSVQSSMRVGMRDKNGRIGITGSFAPQNRERFEVALRDELDKVLKEGFSALEVSFAKDAILRNRRQFITHERNVAGMLADNLYWGKTMERREQRDKQYAELTTEQVNAALRKYLDPDKFSAAMAGDFEKK
ncbi:MAG: M16 family metallopeptidase, partial [Noviherbaspirillum sp.]